jgi:hypothetical protein
VAQLARLVWFMDADPSAARLNGPHTWFLTSRHRSEPAGNHRKGERGRWYRLSLGCLVAFLACDQLAATNTDRTAHHEAVFGPVPPPEGVSVTDFPVDVDDAGSAG